MRSRNRRPVSQVPEVNLVPMMDVLMTVLTFFIIISMTLTNQGVTGVELPEADLEASSGTSDVEPLIVGLDSQGNTLIADEIVSSDELTAEVIDYFTAHPDGIVRIKADRSLSYDDVKSLLQTMQAIGGNRVSLAIE